jgi:transcriptional regulator PpsR
LKKFSSSKRSLGELDTESAAAILVAASDIALVLDPAGTIRDVAIGSADLAASVEGNWKGQAWAETVTVESRPKVASLLQDAARGAPSRWRQVNHLLPDGTDFPVTYRVLSVGEKGRLVAIGRDLRDLAALQQRLVDAQQSIDREYSRLRHAETRSRLLFALASEAVLILEAATLRIVEANPASTQLLGLNSRRLSGRTFPEVFDDHSGALLETMLANVRAGGRPTDIRARLADKSREVLVSASVFREDRATLLLVRASPLDGNARDSLPGTTAKFADLVAASPDGFVVVDGEGKVLTANAAFLDLVQLPGEERARGESLDAWLGRPGVDLNVLLSQLREHGTVRLFVTTLKGASGLAVDVELSGSALIGSEPPCFGLAIRDVGARIGAPQRSSPPLSRSVEELTDLVGRMPLKGIVRETSDIIERLCIEAALELTRDNRASAAEMLGLSRQSLYVKLRRYGLGELVDGDGEF